METFAASEEAAPQVALSSEARSNEPVVARRPGVLRDRNACQATSRLDFQALARYVLRLYAPDHGSAQACR